MADPDTDDEAEISLQEEIIKAIGGWRGAVDSALPATAFIVTRIIAGGMLVPTLVALGVGLGAVGLRRLHGLTLMQAWGGFFGLGIAILVAKATGKGEGFFLPGIISTASLGVAFTLSLVVRRPAVGLALATYDAKYEGWRENRALLRACTIATAAWAVTFFVRAGIATWFYRQPGDEQGKLLIVTNAVKWPLTIGAAFLTWVLIRRAMPSKEPEAEV